MGLFGGLRDPLEGDEEAQIRRAKQMFPWWQGIDRQSERVEGGLLGGMPAEAPQGAPQRGFWQGGQKVGGRDVLAGLMAIIGDTISRNSGGQGFATQGLMGGRLDALEMAKAAQAAQVKRQHDWDDKVAWHEYQRANPMPVNNDTINDFNWYKGLSDEDRQIYHQMKPEYRQGPDGKFYRIDIGEGPMPTRPVGKLTQLTGGGTGNGVGGF